MGTRTSNPNTFTPSQAVALLNVYNRDRSIAPTFRAFAETAQYDHLMGCILVPWKGMALGIETDGYTHS